MADNRVSDQPAALAIAGFDQTVECAGSNGSPVTLNGSASGDQDSDILTYEWADSLGNMVGASAIATAVAQMGTQTYTLNVTDPSGLSACRYSISVMEIFLGFLVVGIQPYRHAKMPTYRSHAATSAKHFSTGRLLSAV